MTPTEIREVRQALGLTQTAFGELLHAKLRTVQAWELGERQMPAATAALLKLKMEQQK